MPGQPPGDVVPSPAAARVDIPEVLPVGVASEAGLQANTIVAARAISARFPEIADIDGVRPDSKPWHPSGLAIDMMIPNPDSAEGIALGDEILAFVLSNTARFGLQDAIWRGTYYTPGGPQGRATATMTTCTSPRHHAVTDESASLPPNFGISGSSGAIRLAPK